MTTPSKSTNQYVKPAKSPTRGEPKTAKSPVGPMATIDAYYDAVRKEYLVQNDGGRWLHHASTAFKMILRQLGYSTKVSEDARVSPAESVMMEIMNSRDVRYAGALAGRDPGFYEEDGVRMLVTDAPKLIAPAKGSWDEIQSLLRGLVGSDPEHGQAQLDTLFAWLKISVETLFARKLHPAQALALAGPPGCGKSLLQRLITAMLGGRCAKPFRYLCGLTTFNAELFAAEHLALEDEQSSTDIRARSAMAAQIKAISVNETQSCHAKGRDAVLLRPFWRLSISLNDNPENLLVLPPVTEDIADKLILLKCSPPLNGFHAGTPDLRAAYWQRLSAELPAFVHHLNEWRIPENMREDRYGVRHFHHPELLESLEALAPEGKLLELIDRELWRVDGPFTWHGTAGELESILRRENSEVRHEIQRLFGWPLACGTYLGRLAVSHPDRVQHHRTAAARKWYVKPPPRE